jgi:biotin carboxylase
MRPAQADGGDEKVLESTAGQWSRRCAVVDADGTGRFLSAALAQYATQCVHVRSPNPCIYLGNNQHGIATEVRHAGDVGATATALRRLGVDHVIAGAESGVQLADQLAQQLGLPGNGMRHPSARRNKHEMAEAVRRAGLATAQSLLSRSADELAEWAATAGHWPVVLKPTESAGADNVIFCFCPADIRAACERIMSSTDRYGRVNTEVLAQQFLTGDEYFVNAVSRDGIHHIVEIWRYHKQWVHDNRLVYDYEHPVVADDPAAVEVGRFALAVLDALEIYNSASHAEVMLTPAGPALVECAARVGGSHLPHIVSRCLGTSQVDVTALSIARPAEFFQLAGTPYQLATNVRYVSLISPRAGTVPSDSALDPVRSLPSFAEMRLTSPAAARLPATVDLATSPGYVYLISDDPGRLEADYRRLRELEDTVLYQAPAVAA